MFLLCCWPCQSADALYLKGMNCLENVVLSVYSFKTNSSSAEEINNFNRNAILFIKALKLLKAAADKNHDQARITFGSKVKVNNEALAKLICETFQDVLEKHQINKPTDIQRTQALGNLYTIV